MHSNPDDLYILLGCIFDVAKIYLLFCSCPDTRPKFNTLSSPKARNELVSF